MPEVAYQDQTINTSNPLARYAHRAHLRRSIACAGFLLPYSGRLLDFGAGMGDFLNGMKRVRPDSELLGFKPYMQARSLHWERVKDMSSVWDKSIDVLTCFEVLEHLTDEKIQGFLADTKHVLRPRGVVIVSVPIIGGLTLLRQWNHKGFDSSALGARLSREFDLKQQMLCPFPWLPWWLNSQAFMVLKARG